MPLSERPWVVFLHRKQYCYGCQRLTSRTDYFMNALVKTMQILIYPSLSVRWKVQDEDKFHHNILYF